MYEIFPIGAGVLVGIAVAVTGRARLSLPFGLVLCGLGLALLTGVAVSFASGEWRGGVVYLLWDAFQATCAYALSLAVGRQWIGRRARHEEG
ncbi:MAG: hypothetical protein QOI91_1825 [Solirubrobacteraceae bacterium]|nr:hypothetical protein [Solirubrobacteraceae bacterium]